MNQDRLVAAAREAAGNAFAPYSRFRVGAALLCRDGTIITGANVENRSYSMTMCAERSAIFAAVSSGARDFEAIAIAGVDSEDPLPPCGACRQVMSEFMNPTAPIIFSGRSEEIIVSCIAEALPFDSLQDLDQFQAPGAP